MSDLKNITRIPHFLIASTPLALQKMMLENNLKSDKPFDYFSISPLPSGEFIAWYFNTIEADYTKQTRQ